MIGVGQADLQITNGVHFKDRPRPKELQEIMSALESTDESLNRVTIIIAICRG